MLRCATPYVEERQRGKAIPEQHAALLQQAMTSAQNKLSTGKFEEKYVELATAIAPLEREKATKLLDEFKKGNYPLTSSA